MTRVYTQVSQALVLTNLCGAELSPVLSGHLLLSPPHPSCLPLPSLLFPAGPFSAAALSGWVEVVRTHVHACRWHSGV